MDRIKELEKAENAIISLGLLKHEFELKTLVRNCEELEKMLIQKTGGEQGKKGDIDFDNLFRIKANIIVEAVMLVRKMKEKGLV